MSGFGLRVRVSVLVFPFHSEFFCPRLQGHPTSTSVVNHGVQLMSDTVNVLKLNQTCLLQFFCFHLSSTFRKDQNSRKIGLTLHSSHQKKLKIKWKFIGQWKFPFHCTNAQWKEQELWMKIFGKCQLHQKKMSVAPKMFVGAWWTPPTNFANSFFLLKNIHCMKLSSMCAKLVENSADNLFSFRMLPLILHFPSFWVWMCHHWLLCFSFCLHFVHFIWKPVSDHSNLEMSLKLVWKIVLFVVLLFPFASFFSHCVCVKQVVWQVWRWRHMKHLPRRTATNVITSPERHQSTFGMSQGPFGVPSSIPPFFGRKKKGNNDLCRDSWQHTHPSQ